MYFVLPLQYKERDKTIEVQPSKRRKHEENDGEVQSLDDLGDDDDDSHLRRSNAVQHRTQRGPLLGRQDGLRARTDSNTI